MIKVNQNRGKYQNSKTGVFYPLNPKKYIGKELPIFKSQLEFKMMRYLDSNQAIEQWTYEPRCIKYYDPISKKERRYFIDFIAKVKTGIIQKTIWIEVKCEKEANPPKNKNNIQAQKTWILNCSKWKAAMEQAKKQNCEFHIITEKQLN